MVHFNPTNLFVEKSNTIFESQKERILKNLPSADIHHIGSTAIPGTVTKGDLDLVVRISSQDFKDAVEKLKSLYDINQPENWTDAFAGFKDEENLGIDFGLQLVVIDSKYDDFVKLRDVLISNPELLKAYNEMKLKYEGRNMDDYRKEKAQFFQRLREKYL